MRRAPEWSGRGRVGLLQEPASWILQGVPRGRLHDFGECYDYDILAESAEFDLAGRVTGRFELSEDSWIFARLQMLRGRFGTP